MALDAYAGGVVHPDRATSLGDKLKQFGILNGIIEQESDSITSEATVASKSLHVATAIAKRIRSTDALFVPLCRGGLVAGLQAALLYSHITGASARVYPMRFSTRKDQQNYPSISYEELEHIDEISRDRTLVVYDEDASTGNSVVGAIQFLRQRVGYSVPIIGAVNSDFRSPQTRQDTGGQWFDKA